jgi:hypothetical protein
MSGLQVRMTSALPGGSTYFAGSDAVDVAFARFGVFALVFAMA